MADALSSMKSLKTLHNQERAASLTVQRAKKTADTERGRLLKAALPLVTKAQTAKCQEVTGLSLDLTHLAELLGAASISPSDLDTVLSAAKALVGLEPAILTRRDDLQRDRNQLHTIKSQYKIYPVFRWGYR